MTHRTIRISRLAVAVLALAAALGACVRGRDDDLRTLRRIPLPDSLPDGATLAFDSLDRAWVGTPGRLTAYDSTGRVVARLPIPGEGAPRVLWAAGARLVARQGDRLLLVDPGTAKVAAMRASNAPVARDPRGRWIYSATRTGGVLGLDPASLKPKWGWPDAGSRATAIAVSPLGDRVYVALAGDGDRDLEPVVQVRDAFSGRLLSEFELDGPLAALAARHDGTLYAVADGAVARLRHGPGGLSREWRVSPGGDGRELRMAPVGGRVAVVEPGEGARVLHAGTGAVVGSSNTAPLDVAYDGKGRLWMLYPRQIRVLR
jgi:hypothetical protein